MATQPHHNPVTKAIWNGKLPIQFSLHPEEITALGAARTLEPYFIEVPRCFYLPLLTGQIRKYFFEMGLNFIGDDAEIWYEFDGMPLKWHYPIGLLYDLHTATYLDSPSSSLPWPLTVRFQNFPADKLIRSQAIDSTQDFFMSMVKEADYLRNGSTKKVMNLSKHDQTQLWDGLWSNDYDHFWSVNHRLVTTSDGQTPRHIPLRIYLPDNCPVIQEATVPCDEEGNIYSLGEVLHHILPDLFPIPTPSFDPDHEVGHDHVYPTPLALPVLHGIVPQLDIPIIWASQHLSYPDNFLHVVVVFSQESA